MNANSICNYENGERFFPKNEELLFVKYHIHIPIIIDQTKHSMRKIRIVQHIFQRKKVNIMFVVV